MKNILISSLLFFGGIYVSLGTNKSQGLILIITLLIIVSLSLLFNFTINQTEHFDTANPGVFNLLTSGYFKNGENSPLSTNVSSSNLQGWNIDEQYKTPNQGNRIYEQIIYALNEIAPSLIPGQKVDMKMNSGGGDSNGSTISFGLKENGSPYFIYNGETIEVPIAGCNYKDSNRCIFKGYNINGELCDSGNGYAYGRITLAGDNENNLKAWLRALYDRKGGDPGQINEADAVREYINRCRNTPEGSFAKGVLTEDELKIAPNSIPKFLKPAGYNLQAQSVDQAAAQAKALADAQAKALADAQAAAQAKALADAQLAAQSKTQATIAMPQLQSVQNISSADVRCRRFLERPPNPPFNNIVGKYGTNTIENIQFKDANNNIVESGTSQKGTDFSYKCPDGTNIVGYSINNQGKERPDTSIFGGFGPVYCADGTVVGANYGKASAQVIGEQPKTELSNYNLVDTNLIPFNDTLMGQIRESDLNQCAYLCNYLNDSCGGFSYNTGNKTCGLAYSIDSSQIIPQSGGRTYQKRKTTTKK